jgi:cytochrome c oxidase subunit 2
VSPLLVRQAVVGQVAVNDVPLLSPAGPQAERIAQLGTILFVIAALVFVVVIAAVAASVRRGRRRAAAGLAADDTHDSERRMGRTIGVAAGISAAVLLGFVLASARVGAALDDEADPRQLTVVATGHQWWWEFTYRDPVPSRSLTTANELHVPVGRPVRIVVTSTDVIHSFWPPNLHGKRDMIPGKETVTYFRADTAGVYHGFCGEFCGHQHAKMQFEIVADPPARFAEWYAAQLQPAPEPVDSSARRGREVFLGTSCIMCHTIAGTPAGSRVGPDLTHLASRRTIAAASLPNTRGHLAGWILDPQRIKPGTKMPPNQLSADDLNALLDYLGGLR